MRPKILSKKTMYKSDWLEVFKAKIRLPNKEVVEWDYLKGQGAIGIVPIDDKNNVYLSKEWRVTWDDYLTQIPAGGCKSKTEKGRIKQVHTELREEIGMDAKKIVKLAGPLMLTTRENQTFYIYLATGLFKSKKERDSTEIIEVVKMPFKKAYKQFMSGKIKATTYSLVGLVLAKEKLGIKVNE